MSNENEIIRTGVYQKYNRQVDIEWLVDECEYNGGINTTFADALREHVATCTEKGCIQRDHDWFNESWESDEDQFLIGDWELCEDGETYEAVENGENGFCAIVRSDVIQVVWSTEVKRFRSMCSPCYPNQVDADSGECESGGFLAYALPDDAYYEE